MTELASVHALVELDPDAQQEIQSWRDQLSAASDDERNDILIRLDRCESGREISMRLLLTIELAADDGSERQPGPSISGVWFTRDDEAGNRGRARQLVIQRLRSLVDELAENGVHQRTVGVPVVPELGRCRRGGAPAGRTARLYRR
jgi:hypothetical protein